MDGKQSANLSGKVRVRGCGVLTRRDKILMVKHIGLGPEGHYWIPPGGGVEFGDSIEETIQREFKEETGLIVKPTRFLFVNEFKNEKLHAIEIFVSVEYLSGELIKGRDPEFEAGAQIIEEVRFLSLNEIALEGPGKVHPRFFNLSSLDQLFDTKAFFNFENISLK